MAETPQKVGPYQILRKLGEGGMGAVYEGIHELIERKVAIKILHREYAQRPEFISRFFNEARAVNRIEHPGLVQVSDYGQLPDSTAYIVMELLQGESLSSRMKKSAGPLSLDQVLNFGSQVADALAAAHEKGIIHRDLKPDNVMVVADAQVPGGERTKLLDFGIAKLADEGGGVPAKTATDAVMGTVYYMSPEQCRGAGKVDSRTDVYSLGVMLYEMLSGERPLTGEGQGDIIVKHLTEEPAPLASKVPQVPKQVAELVHRMLIKNKDQRPGMPEVAAELSELSALTPPPPARRRPTNSMPVITPIALERSGSSTLATTAAGQKKAALRRRRLGLAAVVLALLIAGGLGLRLGLRPPPTPATPPAVVGVPAPPPAPAPTPPTPPTPAEPGGDKGGVGAAKGGAPTGGTATGPGKKGKRKAVLKSIHAKGGRQIED